MIIIKFIKNIKYFFLRNIFINLFFDSDYLRLLTRVWAFVNLFNLFPVLPLGGSTLRAVKKEKKFYLYDWTLVENESYRFENLVACHLLKWAHYQEDIEGYPYSLRYFRDRDGREVDFILIRNEKPEILIECKLSETSVSESLLYLKRRFSKARAIQLVLNPSREFTTSAGVEVISAIRFLNELV